MKKNHKRPWANTGFFPANVDLKYANSFTSSKVWGVTVKPALQWPLNTIAAITQRETVFLGKRKLCTMETSLRARSSSTKEVKWAKFYPSSIWIMAAELTLSVFLKVWDRSGCQSTGINPQTTHKSQITHYKFPASLLRVAGGNAEKGKPEDEVQQKTEQVCDLPNPPCLIFLSSGRTCTENASGSAQGLWQVPGRWWMDQTQHLDCRMIRFRNEGDEWQWLRRWAQRGPSEQELHHLFLHEEDNQWGDNSSNAFPARNIGLGKNPPLAFVLVLVGSTRRGLKDAQGLCQFCQRVWELESLPWSQPSHSSATASPPKPSPQRHFYDF